MKSANERMNHQIPAADSSKIDACRDSARDRITIRV
jgi:hypothetical protein